MNAEEKARGHQQIAAQDEEVIMNSDVIKLEELLPEPG